MRVIMILPIVICTTIGKKATPSKAFNYDNMEDPDKMVSILAIAVITLMLLLALNMYKVHKLKAKLKAFDKKN